MRPDPATSLDSRRLAVVAALHAVRAEPRRLTVASPQWTEQRDAIVALQAEVRRLTDRLARVEDTVELIREDEEAPLCWPAPVAADSPIEVPPFDISRRPSPAFDVLLGPPPAKDQARDSA